MTKAVQLAAFHRKRPQRHERIALSFMDTSVTSSVHVNAPNTSTFLQPLDTTTITHQHPTTPTTKMTVHSMQNTEEWIEEYVEEQLMLENVAYKFPVRLSGWLLRREGLWRQYKRRFCVFDATTSTLCIYQLNQTNKRKLLRRMVVTNVQLTSRHARTFYMKGYAEDKELFKKQSDAMAKRASTLSKRSMPGDCQRFYLPEEEFLRAPSDKATKVWAQCFRHHMWYNAPRQRRKLLRQMDENQQETELSSSEEDEDDEELMMNPDFQFEVRGVVPEPPKASISQVFDEDQEDEEEDEHQEDAYDGSALYPTDRTIAMVSLPPLSRVSIQSTASSFTSDGDSGFADFHANTPALLLHPPSETNQEEEEEEEVTILSSVSSAFSVSASSCSSSALSLTKSIWTDHALLLHRVDFDAIQTTDLLATGAFGEVWKATYRDQVVVIKRLQTSKRKHATRAQLEQFLREIRILSALQHEKIVLFLGVAWTMEVDVQFMMEYLPNGDLRTFLDVSKHQSSDAVGWTKIQWRLAIDVIEALVYLHSLQPALVHCDLKSRNVLLNDVYRARVGDFGISQYVHDDESDKLQVCDLEPEELASERIGTGRWMAPEVLSGRSSCVSTAIDMYAFGILLSEIDTCEIPFQDRVHSTEAEDTGEWGLPEVALLHHIVVDGWKPRFRVFCPAFIRDLAHECLDADPTQRPNALDVAYRIRKEASKAAAESWQHQPSLPFVNEE